MLSDLQVKDAVDAFLHRKVTMVTSATATGKSTLIPQEVYAQLKVKLGRAPRVVVAVPTRIAAQALADRIHEKKKDPELIVDARFRGKSANPQAQLVYSTSGLVMLDYLHVLEQGKDPEQFPWDFVIVDEVHTGDFSNSLIFSFHELLSRRLGSATPKMGLLSATPVEIYVFPGVYENRLILSTENKKAGKAVDARTFLLQKSLAPRDVAKAMVNLIKNIHEKSTHDNYAILAFVEGIRSLNILYQSLLDLDKVQVVKAYGGMSPYEWQVLGERPKRGVRKIVIATNVAESSITVPGVAYVVDSMLEKRPRRGIVGSKSSLGLNYVSASSSMQRRGRAGRDINIYKQYYYPMVTAEEWEAKIQSVPSRIPDIKVVALERTALMLITHDFNPRQILMEAGQDAVSTTLLNLYESKIIDFNGFRILPGQENRLTQSLDLLAQQENRLPRATQSLDLLAQQENRLPRATQSLDLPNGLQKPLEEVQAEALRLLASGTLPRNIGEVQAALTLGGLQIVREQTVITGLDKFWSSFDLGLIPALFLRYWLETRNTSPLMGCLVAAILDSDMERLFPWPSQNKKKNKVTIGNEVRFNRLRKYEYYREQNPQYIAEDPLTTILCVFYDLFRAQPQCLALDFNRHQIYLWCQKRQLNAKIIFDVLLLWKNIVSRLNEERYYNFGEFMEIADVMKKSIEALQDKSFFQLQKGDGKEYFRSESQIPCFIDFTKIPYEPYAIPTQLLFLNIREEEDRRRNKPVQIVTLFFPKVFVFRRHFKRQFLLGENLKVPKELSLVSRPSWDVRLPVVEPEDIGLVTGTFLVPAALGLAPSHLKPRLAAQILPEEGISKRKRYFTSLYPEVLAPEFYNIRPIGGTTRSEEGFLDDLFLDYETLGTDFALLDTDFEDADLILGAIDTTGEGLAIEQDFDEEDLYSGAVDYLYEDVLNF